MTEDLSEHRAAKERVAHLLNWSQMTINLCRPVFQFQVACMRAYANWLESLLDSAETETKRERRDHAA